MNHAPGKTMMSEKASDLGARPSGDPIRVSGRGNSRRLHFNSLEFLGFQYELEETVLLVPEEPARKPYVATIKGISQKKCEGVKLEVQWFYRPEDALMKSGGYWKGVDTRELFYSFHRDEVVAESIMHKALVHFLPLDQKLPERKKNPGFIVQCVYDTEQKILRKLADKEFDSTVQKEIDVLLQKTASRLGL